MRLHSLELTAFGPFAGTEVIDLDRLAASGLFLLEGPTGAGKSTVLDAITFALYGAIADDAASPDRLHSHFADPATTPSVTLDFSVGGQRFRVHRVPAHQRPKRRGQGTTLQPASVRLERHESGEFRHLEHSAAEVGTVLTEAIGLSRDQFTQVVLLPQGEFATFLRAGDDERRALLTRLFGTQRYDRITRELETRRTAAGQARERALHAVDLALAGAAEAAGLEGDQVGELVGVPADQRPAALDAMGEVLSAHALTAERERALAVAELAQAQAARAGAAADAALHTELVEILAGAAAHGATRHAHEARVESLRLARAAEPVRVLLDQLDSADLDLDRAQTDLAGILPSPSPAALAGEGADQHDAEAHALDALATSLEPLVALETGAAGRRADLAALDQALARVTHDCATLRAAQATLPDEIAGAEADRDTAAALAAVLPDSVLRRDDLARHLSAATALAELRPQLAHAADTLSVAEDTKHAEADRHLELLRAHLEGMATLLASQLVPGEACTVCGSTVHPAPARQGVRLVTAEQVDLARHRADVAATKALKVREERDALALECRELTATSGGLGVAELQASLAVAVDQVSRATRADDQLPTLRARVEELQRRREEISTELVVSSGALAAADAAVRTARAAVEEADAAVRAGRADHPSVAARQRSSRADAQHHRDAATAITAVGRARTARSELLDRARLACEAQGLPDVAVARSAVRSAADIRALETEVVAWTTEHTRLTAVAADSRFDGIDPAATDSALAGVAETEGVWAAAEAHAGRAQHRATRSAGQVDQFGRRRADIATAERAAAAVLADTAAVMRLAALAKGTAGEVRMTLTTYVLRHWFDQVVSAANHRLGAMSAGRYELERVDELERGERRTGLSLRVIDRHTGESRSPRSLSGGETFYTSLALALGLADVVRAEAGGVELDTLFIDEGFGSLDAETLDQVMGVIDELRDGGRAVGIVSHVADLKGRISERLEIRSLTGRGSTTLVVA